MTTQTKEKNANTKVAETLPSDGSALPKEAQNHPRTLPFVTLWQDETGVIQIKLGNNITPVNAVALLELGSFRYKAMILPSVSPRPVQAPEGSEPSQGSALKD